MRPTTLLNSAIVLAATASFAVAQSPSVPPTAPSLNSPATTTTSTSSSASTMPSADDMKMMMEMGKLNENHKLLASLDGTWDYGVKMWMDGDTTKKPQESKGVATRKSIMGGRYCTMEVKGKMQMPGADGKMKDMEFNGMALEGYDNAKQKFVATWVDNMGTGIMNTEGTYDAATKTFTHTGEYQMTPTMKQKVKEVIKVTDATHMVFEWYEDRGGKETKTMEIDYTKKK